MSTIYSQCYIIIIYHINVVFAYVMNVGRYLFRRFLGQFYKNVRTRNICAEYLTLNCVKVTCLLKI